MVGCTQFITYAEGSFFKPSFNTNNTMSVHTFPNDISLYFFNTTCYGGLGSYEVQYSRSKF